jgi:hypothetical protein
MTIILTLGGWKLWPYFQRNFEAAEDVVGRFAGRSIDGLLESI